MSTSNKLAATARERAGKGAARATRRDGRVPGVIYGDKAAPTLISLDPRDVMREASKAGFFTRLYDIEVGGKTETAIVHALAWDAFGDEIQHVEFKRVRRDVKTEMEVELEFRGHPKGGMLNHLITHVTVRCLPMDIPDGIEVNVAGLDVGGVVLAKDLALPKGVELVKPTSEFKVAVVVLAKVDVPAAAATEAPAEGGTVAAASATPAAGAAAPAGAKAAAPAKDEKPKKG